ncbi:19291_t:CDS:2 [Dentiscutata erythropus]|uniref:Anthranilate phosphoribosyltransferase n=1 Tax=Dentiscutata erythropus TaxID=1348616 RepID=A0A9N9GPL5_9GLOM|nr:19291_t:CDS:2 [Dentiscutata erythropus]
MTSFPDIIKILVLRPNEFTATHAQDALEMMMEQRATSAQVSAFLVALKLNKKDEDPEIVAACSESLHKFAMKIDFSAYDGLQDSLIDVVGTGGDGMNTFNVSTTTAIVIAGAGCKVAKFGNRAASSQCGSADILEKIGCEITNVTPSKVPHIINSTNFCFLFAPTFHPAVKYVGSTRREILIPTIFNLLGPLSNPARPKRVVIGVYLKSLGKLVADALVLKGVKEAMVVHGDIGLDEISPEGQTFVWHISNSVIKEYIVTPSDFGLPSHPISAVKGGTPNENAELLIQLLSNKYEGPILDFVLLNSSAALVVSGLAKDFKDGVKLARESIINGSAKNALEEFKRLIRNEN